MYITEDKIYLDSKNKALKGNTNSHGHSENLESKIKIIISALLILSCSLSYLLVYQLKKKNNSRSNNCLIFLFIYRIEK